MPTAFVTDGNERSALAITRSLGRRGVSVIVGNDQPISLAGTSRYCANRVTYPSPSREPNAFAAFLSSFVRRAGIDVVIPVSDITTRTVAAERERLAPCAAAVPSITAFEAVTDKSALLHRALHCGVPVPQTQVIRGLDELPHVIGELRYPVVVKPSRSRVQAAGRWIPSTVRYASNAGDMQRLYRESAELRDGVSLVQERVVGPATGLFVLCDRGRILTAFAHRRLREKPPSGGVSVCCESVRVNPQLLDHAERLLAPLEWHGVAMLEYKHDCRSERIVLIEINGRFWGSLQLAIDAGVDFPYLSWQLARGETPSLPASYAVGLKSRWTLGDLDHLLSRMRSGGDLPADAPSKPRVVLDFVSGMRVRGEVLRFRDPAPGIYELRAYAASIVDAAVRRAKTTALRSDRRVSELT